MALEDLAKAVADMRKRKGFYTPPSISGRVHAKHVVRNSEMMLAKLMLVTTEVAEAAEACRDENMKQFGEELADIIIRVLDITASCEIDIGVHVRKKLAAWILRPSLHGRKIRL